MPQTVLRRRAKHLQNRIGQRNRRDAAQRFKSCSCLGSCSRCHSSNPPTVTRPGDAHEREADAMTARAMAHNPVTRGSEAPVPTAARTNISSGTGRPLSRFQQEFFQSRLGRNFGEVRVHTDQAADNLTRSFNARAVTHGSNIYFARDEGYRGKNNAHATLTHELAHVVQHSTMARPPVARKASFREKLGAVFGAGPIDAYRAKKLATESLSAARSTGLPGAHNGPQDAWRHCYWNCRMAHVIGKEDAKDIADNHEKHGGGPALENTMDLYNNAVGRDCSRDCSTCCGTRLDSGHLRIIERGRLTASRPTPRSRTNPGTKYKKY